MVSFVFFLGRFSPVDVLVICLRIPEWFIGFVPGVGETFLGKSSKDHSTPSRLSDVRIPTGRAPGASTLHSLQVQMFSMRALIGWTVPLWLELFQKRARLLPPALLGLVRAFMIDSREGLRPWQWLGIPTTRYHPHTWYRDDVKIHNKERTNGRRYLFLFKSCSISYLQWRNTWRAKARRCGDVRAYISQATPAELFVIPRKSRILNHAF